MSELQLQHEAHKARLIRLRARAKPFNHYSPKKPKKPINPHPYYAGMWFWELVSLPPKPNKGPGPKINKIVRAVSDHYGVPADAVMAWNRTARPTHARQVAMYLARELTQASFQQIGNCLGGKDHSTVLHGHRIIVRKLSISPELQRDVEALTERLTFA